MPSRANPHKIEYIEVYLMNNKKLIMNECPQQMYPNQSRVYRTSARSRSTRNINSSDSNSRSRPGATNYSSMWSVPQTDNNSQSSRDNRHVRSLSKAKQWQCNVHCTVYTQNRSASRTRFDSREQWAASKKAEVKEWGVSGRIGERGERLVRLAATRSPRGGCQPRESVSSEAKRRHANKASCGRSQQWRTGTRAHSWSSVAEWRAHSHAALLVALVGRTGQRAHRVEWRGLRTNHKRAPLTMGARRNENEARPQFTEKRTMGRAREQRSGAHVRSSERWRRRANGSQTSAALECLLCVESYTDARVPLPLIPAAHWQHCTGDWHVRDTVMRVMRCKWTLASRVRLRGRRAALHRSHSPRALGSGGERRGPETPVTSRRARPLGNAN